jgi:hypothetical protein
VEIEMAEHALNLECQVYENGPGYSIELNITGIPTQKRANELALWVRNSLKAHVSEIGRLDAKPPFGGNMQTD